MANEQNLKRPSSKEARELGSKGGIASGVARREKRTLRQLLEIALKDVDAATGLDNATAMTVAVLERAKGGDVKAFETIRDTIGEKPVDKIEMTKIEQDIMDMTPEQRTEYAIKMLKDRGAL